MRELYGSIRVPHGEAEVREVYGDIQVETVNGQWKIVGPKNWEEQNMVVVRDFPGLHRPLYVHRKIVEPLRAALTEWQIWIPEYEIKTIGCFNVRANRHNPKKLSLHAFGAACDINASTNPMRRPLMTDMPRRFVEGFQRAGWKWGGEFATPDPQHVQLATGY